MQEQHFEKKHTVFSENRQRLELGGIIDVGTFNEEEITARCSCGRLLIKGEGLHIEVLELETGVLHISGKINALVYSDTVKSGGFFERLFKS